MINFFRKTRKKLADDNKPLKYLRYAIGEIVLVVIGILLALNINNSNQQQINDAKITSILKEIQQDLVRDVERSKQIFDRYIKDDSIRDLILNNKFTRNDFTIENINRNRIGYQYVDFVINTSGYDNLMGNINNVPQKYQSILKDLKHLYVTIKTKIDVYNTRIRETTYKNVDDLYNQSNWNLQEYSGIVSDEAINYYLHDAQYKNMVNRYMNDRVNVFSRSQQYRYNALETYLKIQELTESTDSIPKTLGLEPKTETFFNSVVGTYKIKDSTLAGWHKELKISYEGKELHFIVEENDVNFKLGHHKESIFGLNGALGYVRFNTPNEGELIVKRPISKNAATFSKVQ